MSKYFPLFLSFLLTTGFASAQNFDLIDLLYSGEAGIPSAVLREPFPWGLAPRNMTIGSLLGSVTEILQETTYFDYSFDAKVETGKDTTSWLGGGNPGDWACSGKGAGWLEGDSHFYWDEAANVLYEWKGAWEDPLFVKRYQSGSRMPFEYWSKEEDNRDRWHHANTDGDDETWIRTTTALVTRWTCYDGNGTASKRLLVEKDSRSMVSRVEYWNTPSTKALEILETRADPGFVVRGRQGENMTLEGKFQRSYAPVSMVTNLGGSESMENRYSPDYTGRITEILFLHNGKPESKLSLSRDQIGNPISERRFKVDSSFGESLNRESSFTKRVILYRRSGEVTMAMGRPRGLDEWLDLASPGSLAAALQSPSKGDSEASSLLPLPQPLPDATASAAAAPEARTWQASTELDPLTDAEKYSVRLESSLPRTGYLDPITLWVCNQGKGLESFISFGEIIATKGKLALRFDSDAPIYLNPGEWSLSADGESAFIKVYKINGISYNVQDFVKRIGQKKTLFVQAQKYDGSQLSAKFDLPGFRTTVESLLPYDKFISSR